LKHAKGLKFEEEPDYGFIKDNLKIIFQGNGYKYDDNFDWIENRGVPSHKSSTFLHLINKQQEIARRNSARHVLEREEKNDNLKSSQMLKAPVNEQNSNSLAVNYSSYFMELPSGENQEKNSGNQKINKSPRNLSPAATSKKDASNVDKKETTKCQCLLL